MCKKYIDVISILVIVIIGLGCVDKSLDDTVPKTNLLDDKQANITISERENISTVDNESVSESDNLSTVDDESISESDNLSTDEDELVSDTIDLPVNNKEEYIYGNATIENLNIQILDSNPYKINVTVNGYLRDVCTEMDKIGSTREQNYFYISIKTIRPEGKACENLPYFFEKVVPLDTQKLSPGVYYVMVNNMISSFEIK